MTDAPKLSKLGQAALAYARLGWPVFTLQPRSKKPMGLCNSVGADGEVCDARLPAKDKATGETTCKACGTIHTEPGGLYAATTDEATITRWWTKEPKANIGIRCGAGLLVVDIDIPNPDEGKTEDGEATLALLEVENDEFPKTPNQRTGEIKQADGTMRRGRQYVFRVEGEVRNTARKLGPGIDTRGDGGYIVAAPSIHPSGVAYAWEEDARPSKTPLAPAPAWLLEKLAETKKLSEVARPVGPARPSGGPGKGYGNTVLDGEYDRAARAPKGTRNQALNTAGFKCGQLVAGGVLEESQVRSMLEAAAEASGWAAEEGPDAVAKVIASSLSAGMKAPRTMPERQPQTQLRVVSDNTKSDPRDEQKPEPKPADLKTGWIEGWDDEVIFKEESRILQPKALSNGKAVLLYRREFVDLFRFNDRSQSVVMTRTPPWSDNGGPYPRNITDNDITGFRCHIEQAKFAGGLRLNDRDCRSAVIYAAKERHFDPALESLTSFVWDGVDRLDHWLIDYMGAEDNSFVRQAGAKWMIAAAKRVIYPGCKFDNMLVLEGEQGIQKSMALRAIAETLAQDAFSDNVSDISKKDAMIELCGTIIVEAAEMAAFKNANADQAKRFLAAQDDKVRLPHDKMATVLKRGCVFAGTLNPDGVGWHTDHTGGRRFWPVAVTRVDYDRLRTDAPQLWAEARVRMEAGEAVWLDDKEVADQAAEAMLSRMVEDPWGEQVDHVLRDKDAITIPALLKELGIDNARQASKETRRIAGILRDRGWRRIVAKGNDGASKRMWGAPKKGARIRRDLLDTEEDTE
jgi:predicted P-loop ATPase